MVLTSTKLVQHLQDRAQRIAGRNPAARIVVPEDMKWVLVQEHGSIGPYPITPKNADSLRLPPKEDFPLYHGSVEHPGVSPKKFITAIEQDIQELAGKSSARVLVESQFDPDAVQEALVDQIMPEIKEMIAKSMSDVLHQNRTIDFPGKLGTTTPADAFREKAEIEES